MAELHRDQRDALAGWDAYAAGRCTLPQAQQAARAAGQSEADIARAAELFAPLDERTLAGFTSAITAADARRGDEVIRPARWLRPAIAGGLALLAAGVVLWIARPGPTGAGPSAAPMVAHELSITGVAEVRGDAVATPSVPAGSSLTFTLRPKTRHDLSPVVWACAVRGDEQVVLSVSATPAQPGGALRVTAPLPAGVTPGAWELVAFVSSAPSPAQGVAACELASGGAIQASRQAFVVR